MKKIMLGTSDTWLMSRSSHRPSKPAYYIEDCQTRFLCFKFPLSPEKLTKKAELLFLNDNISIYTKTHLALFLVNFIILESKFCKIAQLFFASLSLVRGNF